MMRSKHETDQDPRRVLLESVDEKTFMQQVVTALRLLGYMVYHTLDSRGSEPGYPDLFAVHPEQQRLLVIELKSEKGQLTAAQARWLQTLEGRVVQTHVWRPSSWPEIERVLWVKK